MVQGIPEIANAEVTSRYPKLAAGGTYNVAIDRFFAKNTRQYGTAVISEFEICEVTPSPNVPLSSLNQTGSIASWFLSFQGNGAETAPGNLKAIVLAILGISFSDAEAMAFIDQIDPASDPRNPKKILDSIVVPRILGQDNPAMDEQLLIVTSKEQSKKSTNRQTGLPNEFTLHKFYPVEKDWRAVYQKIASASPIPAAQPVYPGPISPPAAPQGFAHPGTPWTPPVVPAPHAPPPYALPAGWVMGPQGPIPAPVQAPRVPQWNPATGRYE